MNDKVFIIAEAGVNHNGSIDLAYKLIDEAKEVGADAVKFQTFKTEKILTKDVNMAKYQKENLSMQQSQYQMLKKLELSYDSFRKLKKYCDKVGIMFLSTPDEEDSLNFLVDELDIPMIKIGSGEINNLLYLKKIARKNKPIILSTGMSTLEEVKRAVEVIRRENKSVKLSLLHCTTNYPASYDEVNLKAMQTLSEAFSVPVGYSDHTLGTEISIAAASMGAKIIEKHFTLDKNIEGPDHRASLNPSEFKDMVKVIRNIEEAFGDGIKRVTKSEKKLIGLIRKKIVAARDIKEGSIIEELDLDFKRSAQGLDADKYEEIIGKKLLKDKKEDEVISWQDVF